MIHGAASAGFQRSADAYDRARPEYPAEAIAWLWAALALSEGTRVIDVGAGTGKLTRPLSERGAEVVAVEPVEAIRRRGSERPGPRRHRRAAAGRRRDQ